VPHRRGASVPLARRWRWVRCFAGGYITV